MKPHPVLRTLCIAGLALALGCIQSSPSGGSPDTLHLTDASFDEAIKSGVTLVDFWAPWCPPCRAQGPIVDRLATAYKGRARVAKLNVDDHNSVAARFGISSIPTLIVFKDGKKVEQFVGLRSEDALKAVLDKHLQ